MIIINIVTVIAGGVAVDIFSNSQAANFQRARNILKAITPMYVNPFYMETAEQVLVSEVPIHGETRFPEYFILIYKVKSVLHTY